MKRSLIPLSIMFGTLAASGAAVADHNSENGEGWANMPNDVHNTRIETREADDNGAFRDFVKYGEGSRTTNRFDSDKAAPAQASKQQGKAKQSQKRDDRKAQNQSEARKRAETHSRIHSDTSMTTQGRRTAGNRSGGRKGGSGKR